MTAYRRPERIQRADSVMRESVDLMMHLSDQARATRRPGQTLQARLNELRRAHDVINQTTGGIS